MKTQKLPLWLALGAAASGGVLSDLANPGAGIWPLILPALLLVIAAHWQQTPWRGALIGASAGAAFWLPHISWLTLYLGPIPWLALCAVMVLWYSVQGILVAVATRGLALLGIAASPVLLAFAQAGATAGIWVLRETVQGAWPYGGFAWGRVAHVFAASPYSGAVSWLGFAGLSGMAVFIAALLVAAMSGLWATHRRSTRAVADAKQVVIPPAHKRAPLLLSAAAALFAGVLAALPAWQLPVRDTLKIAAVQGNSKSGIFDDRESGDVFAAHLQATQQLIAQLRAEKRKVDVIVWPENSAEFGITTNSARAAAVARLSAIAGAPIVLGAVLENDHGARSGSYTNSSLVWTSSGQQQPVRRSRYDKHYPVPFAEYMPNREFFHALVPDLVDLVQLEYTPGRKATTLPIATKRGEASAGIAICFDIIFDQQARDMVSEGAEVIFAQSNNADFGHTDESAQQLQIARLRAIETGRAVVNISTVATSRIIAPDGADLAKIAPFQRGSLVAKVPLVTGSTPAMQYGALIASAWLLVGLAGAINGASGLVKARKRVTKVLEFDAR